MYTTFLWYQNTALCFRSKKSCLQHPLSIYPTRYCSLNQCIWNFLISWISIRKKHFLESILYLNLENKIFRYIFGYNMGIRGVSEIFYRCIRNICILRCLMQYTVEQMNLISRFCVEDFWRGDLVIWEEISTIAKISAKTWIFELSKWWENGWRSTKIQTHTHQIMRYMSHDLEKGQ